MCDMCIDITPGLQIGILCCQVRRSMYVSVTKIFNCFELYNKALMHIDSRFHILQIIYLPV